MAPVRPIGRQSTSSTTRSAEWVSTLRRPCNRPARASSRDVIKFGQCAVVDASTALTSAAIAKLIARCVLPNTRRAQEVTISRPFDEAKLVETLDLLAAERRLKGEVEVTELLDGGETAGAHRRLQASVVADLTFGGISVRSRRVRRACHRRRSGE